jgi:hypothetical protein
MSEAKRGFVVKATDATGHEMWVSKPRGTVRVFGPRKNADVFRTRLEATAAIVQILASFERPGFTFTVETAN